MQLYFAPLEGITGHLLRQIHRKQYEGIDKYFAPFVTPGLEKHLRKKGFADLLPENNEGTVLVPQILTNQADGFLETARALADMGYHEINLNLGCPSGTVTAKGRGAGFLAFPDELDRFLDRIYSARETVNGEWQISVKTRIGKLSAEEWPRLLSIYNQYPISELIVHPRVQTDLYRNLPNLEAFAYAVRESRILPVYNGDIFDPGKYLIFRERFPEVRAVMLGRGLLHDPALAERIRLAEVKLSEYGEHARESELPVTEQPRPECAEELPRSEYAGEQPRSEYAGELSCRETLRSPAGEPGHTGTSLPPQRERLRRYHDTILAAYEDYMSGDRNVLFKMKELWFYLSRDFKNEKKLLKQIRKCQRLTDYRAIVDAAWSDYIEEEN